MTSGVGGFGLPTERQRIGYLKHAAFDCVSIRARTETQSYQQNLFCGNDRDILRQ